MLSIYQFLYLVIYSFLSIFLQVDEDLELVHSCIETLAACVQISIRGISAYLEFKSIKSHVTSIEVWVMCFIKLLIIYLAWNEILDTL